MKLIRSIEITVETLWNGQVAIRQQFLDQAFIEKKAIIIYHNKGSMRINYTDFKARSVGRSDKKFRDKYNKNKPGYLYYFDWKPEVKQETLL